MFHIIKRLSKRVTTAFGRLVKFELKIELSFLEILALMKLYIFTIFLVNKLIFQYPTLELKILGLGS